MILELFALAIIALISMLSLIAIHFQLGLVSPQVFLSSAVASAQSTIWRSRWGQPILMNLYY